MSNDDLRSEIAAVENEISGLSPSAKRNLKRKRFPWVVLVVTLTLFIVVDWAFLRDSESNLDDDLGHMMQQARHEVLDYTHRYGHLPKSIQNPALKPYIILTPGENNNFMLKGRMGNSEQILILQ